MSAVCHTLVTAKITNLALVVHRHVVHRHDVLSIPFHLLYALVEAFPLLHEAINSDRAEVQKLGRWKSCSVFELAYVREDGARRWVAT